MKINKKYLSTLALISVSIIASPVFSADAADTSATSICDTLNSVKSILRGISFVVVTLAIMWAGYKFLFTRADIGECGKILAAGVMIGSATEIAQWFMRGGKCEAEKESGTASVEVYSCPASLIALKTQVEESMTSSLVTVDANGLIV